MNIRKSIFCIAAAIMCIAAMTSCTKGGMKFFRGSYGYVCSGNIVCRSEMLGTVECPILKESGSLHIEPKGDAAVVTFTSLSGDALVFDAVIDGSDISLAPLKRTVTVEVKDAVADKMKFVPVTMSGKGYKTNALMVISFSVSGEDFEVNVLDDDDEIVTDTFSIVGSNINCVANFRE